MRCLLRFSFLVGVSLLLFPSLSPETAVAHPEARRTSADAKDAPVSFDQDIVPILTKRCHSCHTAAEKVKGGLDMTTYQTFIKGGSRGSPVVPGKSAESLILALMFRDEKPFMPPVTEEPASIEEALLIKRWIDQGAKPPASKK